MGVQSSLCITTPLQMSLLETNPSGVIESPQLYVTGLSTFMPKTTVLVDFVKIHIFDMHVLAYRSIISSQKVGFIIFLSQPLQSLYQQLFIQRSRR